MLHLSWDSLQPETRGVPWLPVGLFLMLSSESQGMVALCPCSHIGPVLLPQFLAVSALGESHLQPSSSEVHGVAACAIYPVRLEEPRTFLLWCWSCPRPGLELWEAPVKPASPSPPLRKRVAPGALKLASQLCGTLAQEPQSPSTACQPGLPKRKHPAQGNRANAG